MTPAITHVASTQYNCATCHIRCFIRWSKFIFMNLSMNTSFFSSSYIVLVALWWIAQPCIFSRQACKRDHLNKTKQKIRRPKHAQIHKQIPSKFTTCMHVLISIRHTYRLAYAFCLCLRAYDCISKHKQTILKCFEIDAAPYCILYNIIGGEQAWTNNIFYIRIQIHQFVV